jgi:predicted membrane-bound spermidine synthase
MPKMSVINRSNTGDYYDIEPSNLVLHFTLYINAFIVGFIIMAFEILGSRYLNPFFGSGIFTWSSLITTVLMALSAGYFIGGYIADKKPSVNLLGFLIFSASIWFGLMPTFANALFGFVFDSINDIRYGSLISSIFLLFVPLSLLGVYSPFAIRLILRSTHISGTVSGRIYGISTLGSIIGTLVTTMVGE